MQEQAGRDSEERRRSLLFEQANEAYAVLRSNPEAWKQELEERGTWDATLMDGIEPEP